MFLAKYPFLLLGEVVTANRRSQLIFQMPSDSPSCVSLAVTYLRFIQICFTSCYLCSCVLRSSASPSWLVVLVSNTQRKVGHQLRRAADRLQNKASLQSVIWSGGSNKQYLVSNKETMFKGLRIVKQTTDHIFWIATSPSTGKESTKRDWNCQSDWYLWWYFADLIHLLGNRKYCGGQRVKKKLYNTC